MNKFFTYFFVSIGFLSLFFISQIIPPYTTGLQVKLFVMIIYPMIVKFGYLGYIIPGIIFFLIASILFSIGKYFQSQNNKKEGRLQIKFSKVLLISCLLVVALFFLPKFIQIQYSIATQSDCTKYTTQGSRGTCYINYEPETYQKLFHECSLLVWISTEDVKRGVVSGYGNTVEFCKISQENIEFIKNGMREWDENCDVLKDNYAKETCENNKNIVQAHSENNPKICPKSTNENLMCLSKFVGTKEWKIACENIDIKWNSGFFQNLYGNCLEGKSINNIFATFLNSDIELFFYQKLIEEKKKYRIPVWFGLKPILFKSYLKNPSLNINTTDSLGRTILVDYIQRVIIQWNKYYRDTVTMKKIQHDSKKMSAGIGFNTDCQSCMKFELDEVKENIDLLLVLGVDPKLKDKNEKSVYEYISQIEIPGYGDKVLKLLP